MRKFLGFGKSFQILCELQHLPPFAGFLLDVRRGQPRKTGATENGEVFLLLSFASLRLYKRLRVLQYECQVGSPLCNDIPYEQTET